MMPIKATKVKSVSTCDHCCNCRRFDMFRYFLLIYVDFNSCGAPLFAAPFSTSRKAAPLLKSALHLKVENIEIRDLSRHIKTPWVWCRPFCRSPRTFMALQVRALTGRLPRCTWKILKDLESWWFDDCLLYQGFVGLNTCQPQLANPLLWRSMPCTAFMRTSVRTMRDAKKRNGKK
jgi:hypothetical protein